MPGGILCNGRVVGDHFAGQDARIRRGLLVAPNRDHCLILFHPGTVFALILGGFGCWDHFPFFFHPGAVFARILGGFGCRDHFPFFFHPGTVFALILGVFGCFVILFILCPAFMRNGDSEQAEGVVRKPNIPVPAYRAGSSGLWPSGAAAEQESEPGEDPSKEHGSINKDHGGRNNHPGRKRPRGLVDVDASFVWTPKIAPSPKGSSFSPKQAGARMMSALSPKTTKIITSLSSPKNALGGEKTRPGSSTKNPFNHLMSVLIHGEHRAVADGPADGGDDHALTARDRAIRQKVLRQKLARPLSRATLAARQAEAAEREAAAVSRRTTEEDPRDNPALPPPERRAPVTGDEGRADYHRVSEQPTGSPFPPDRAGSKRTSARRGSSERGLPQRESYREVRDRLKRPTPQAPKEPSKSIAEIMLEAEKRALSPVDLPVEGDWTPPEGSKGVIVTRTPTEIVITPRL